MIRGLKRLVGDLLTVSGILVVMTIAGLAVLLLIAVVILAWLAPGWELGPPD